MKKSNRRSKKAMTLAEICVVLAVISIVSTVVASFCLMANNRAVSSSNRMQILSEVSAIEKIVEQFVDANATVTVTIEDGVLTAGDKRISFVEGELTAAIRDGEDPIELECETVESVSFELFEKDDKSDLLVFCKVSCKIPLANGESKSETHVFCVNSRLGESAEVSG